MGKSESEALQMLCLSNNDTFKAIELLSLGSHEYIEYYVEELSKEVYQTLYFNLGTPLPELHRKFDNLCEEKTGTVHKLLHFVWEKIGRRVVQIVAMQH